MQEVSGSIPLSSTKLFSKLSFAVAILRFIAGLASIRTAAWPAFSYHAARQDPLVSPNANTTHNIAELPNQGGGGAEG